jgi:NADH-quinone oxidoreductase subunit I
MTPDFDYSVTNIKEHNFAFAVMSAEEINAKQKAWSEHQAAKESAKQTPAIAEENNANQPNQPSDKPKAIKPVFKPKIKPPGSSTPQA